ncbi:hypothetical protein CDAR_240481 [Caerostris darwini]|uniref:Uncharacterized protein n=1 Tax=Caerostris darwini TaxID=1538125 RepID=A0AAV4PNB1_9ARAC|nr:hypothetical protein CDAR_240481 [Caerostris darwini]
MHYTSASSWLQRNVRKVTWQDDGKLLRRRCYQRVRSEGPSLPSTPIPTIPVPLHNRNPTPFSSASSTSHSQHARFRGFASFVYVMKRDALPSIVLPPPPPPHHPFFSAGRAEEDSLANEYRRKFLALIKTFVASVSPTPTTPPPYLFLSFHLLATELKSLVIH